MNKMKFFLAACAAMLITVNAYAQDEVQELVTQYNSALELVNAKKYDEAAKALEAVAKEAKEFEEDGAEVLKGAQALIPQCYLRMGMADARAKNWDEAVEDFNQAISKGEMYKDAATVRTAKGAIATVYKAKGAGAFNEKDYAAAIESFSKGYEANPNDTQLALNLAMSYCEMGDTENGFKVYNEIIALGETHSKYKEAATTAEEKLGYYMTLDIHKALEAKEYAKADQMITALLSEDPKNANGNMLLINSAAKQSKWNVIISKGTAAADAQTNPDMKSTVYYNMAAAYQNSGNTEKAIEYFKRVTSGPSAANAKAQIAALSK